MPLNVLLILSLTLPGCVEGKADERGPMSQSDLGRSTILGIWWSPDMFQSAAFQINDSTIYYPDSFAEYRYELSGDSLFVYREEGFVSRSFIARVTADTLILVTSNVEEIYTRSETQGP